MRKIFIFAVLLLSITAVQNTFSVDCPPGYLSKIENIYDNSVPPRLICTMYLCYKCNVTHPTDVQFKGFTPNPNYDMDVNDMWALCSTKVHDANYLNTLCDIPPCSSYTYHEFLITTPICVQFRWVDEFTWTVWSCETVSGYCWKLKRICFNGTTYEYGPEESGTSGIQNCTDRSVKPRLPYPNNSECWSPPDAWCFIP
jgi:hypothetical protein